MANSFPASGLAYADQFSVGTSNATNSSLYVCSACVQATRIEHIYSQTNLHHNTLWLRAMNSGAKAAASIGFTVVNNGGDHHRANIEATGDSGAIGGNLALYSRRNSDGADMLGLYIHNTGNVSVNTTSPYSGPSQYGALTFPRAQLLFSNTNSQAQFYFVSNGTLNASSQFTYTCNGRAGKINIDDGSIALDVASCGTNGGVISWTTGIQINNGGSVGIGTSSPSSRLDVCGADGRIQSRVDSSDGSTINIRPNAGKCGWISYTEDAVADRWGIGIKNGDAKLYFSSGNVGSGGGTTRMVLDGSGNLGIGTATPCSVLSITTAGGSYTTPETTNVSNIYVYNSNSSCTTAHSMLTLRTNNSTGGNPFISFDVNQVTGWAMGLDNADSDKFKLNWGWSNLTSNTALTVTTSTLNVGIGTSSPLGSSVERTIHLSDAGNGYATLYVTNSTNCVRGIFAIASSQQTISVGSQSNHALRLVTNDTTKMLINTGGCAGIGTTAPCTFLMVKGGTGGAKTDLLSISTTDGAGSQPSMRFDTIEANCNVLGRISVCDIAPYAGSMIFETSGCKGAGSTTTTEVMRLVGTTGNVGIATASPSYRLHVNGTFYAAGSSIKYKEGICNYDTNSCLFMCLKPVTYQYKDEFKHLGKELKSETQIGLIAEEVAEVMPELAILVNEEDEKVVRNVDYEKLSIILLSEVQKLRKEVDQLKQSC